MKKINVGWKCGLCHFQIRQQHAEAINSNAATVVLRHIRFHHPGAFRTGKWSMQPVKGTRL